MSETFTLSGDGLRGYGQHLMAAPLMEQEPVTVRLGRLAPVETGEPKLMLANYFGDAPKAGPLPEIVDWSAKAMASISRMYLNDRLGICVFASAAHQAGLWTANDMDSGGIVLADDDELRSQYRSVCGPFDSGCDIGNVLKYTRDEGLTAGGKKYKIDGWVNIDWTNKDEVKAAIYLFGSIKLGINLPRAWENSAVWDVTNTGIVGGHDVPCVGFNPQGVVIASWAKLYLITWAAFLSRTWLEEAYVPLSPQWYGSDKLAPNGFDVEKLKGDLEIVKGGGIPDTTAPGKPFSWTW